MKEKDMLFWVKLQTGLLAAVLLLVAVFGGLTACTVVKTARALPMEQLTQAAESLRQVSSRLEDADMETLLATAEALRAAANQLTKADMGAVNDAVKALTEAADQLSRLDMQELNDLLDSLKTVTEQLGGVTGGLSRLFQR